MLRVSGQGRVWHSVLQKGVVELLGVREQSHWQQSLRRGLFRKVLFAGGREGGRTMSADNRCVPLK